MGLVGSCHWGVSRGITNGNWLVRRGSDPQNDTRNHGTMSASANNISSWQTGPGHHGDDEYEYEIHHFEKFHDESESLFPLHLWPPYLSRMLIWAMHNRHQGRRPYASRRHCPLQKAWRNGRRCRIPGAYRRDAHSRTEHTPEVSAVLAIRTIEYFSSSSRYCFAGVASGMLLVRISRLITELRIMFSTPASYCWLTWAEHKCNGWLMASSECAGVVALYDRTIQHRELANESEALVKALYEWIRTLILKTQCETASSQSMTLPNSSPSKGWYKDWSIHTQAVKEVRRK